MLPLKKTKSNTIHDLGKLGFEQANRQIGRVSRRQGLPRDKNVND